MKINHSCIGKYTVLPMDPMGICMDPTNKKVVFASIFLRIHGTKGIFTSYLKVGRYASRMDPHGNCFILQQRKFPVFLVY